MKEGDLVLCPEGRVGEVVGLSPGLALSVTVRFSRRHKGGRGPSLSIEHFSPTTLRPWTCADRKGPKARNLAMYKDEGGGGI